VLIHSTSESELLNGICHAAVGNGGYRMAWVGYVEHDEAKSIRLMAQYGFEDGYVAKTSISWSDDELGNGPSGRALRSGKIQISQNIAEDPTMLPWREEALKRGYSSSIALPLIENEKSFGVLTIYSSDIDAFVSEEIELLEEMANDLSFGILTLRIRKAHVQHEQRLHESLLETIQTCASIVEMRDPYTAGHQRRVAEFAKAIAQEMGLPEEEAQVIYLAGLIHDVGKVNIPSEILSKPGKLTPIEYSFVQTHAQAGYDLLKSIHFPWPIAKLIWQHHERMDGSGYPQGLKDEQILLGARILAVADVVEAISSHRPYRPGLGIDAALSEIKSKRGVYFDPQVVDACLRLFHERDYQLPE
jgi:putative nucleotidyltransferase with HDIG domain